jgi:enoyl-CoA hydratase
VEHVRYEVIDHVGVITLDRPDKANAQNRRMLDELHEGWQSAAGDADVRAILVQANGRHFSAGMELAPGKAGTAGTETPAPFSNTADFERMLSWRNVPKPSIAAVQGKCIAAGLLLCWPCDLIVAAEDAEFLDPTLRLGMAGVEYMAHVWELGARKAKEMLFRSTPIGAAEALQLGMVNRIVPTATLRSESMGWAREIASLDPTMTAVAKRAINGTLDIQGFTASLSHCFDLLELAYSLPRKEHSDDLEHMRRTNADIHRRELADGVSDET